MLIKRLATDRPDGPDGVLQARRKWMVQCLKLGAGTAVLTLAGPQLVFGAGIVAVRVWPAEDYTRVTIESDTPLVAVHQMIRDPDRLVVDIDGLDLSPTLRELVAKITPNDPYIQTVRVGQNRPRVVRMVFDLKETSRRRCSRSCRSAATEPPGVRSVPGQSARSAVEAGARHRGKAAPLRYQPATLGR